MIWLIIGGVILLAFLVLVTVAMVQEFGGWLTLAAGGLVVVITVGVVAFGFGLSELVRG